MLYELYYTAKLLITLKGTVDMLIEYNAIYYCTELYKMIPDLTNQNIAYDNNRHKMIMDKNVEWEKV